MHTQLVSSLPPGAMRGIAVAKLIFSLLLVPPQPEGSLRQINGPETGGKALEERKRGEQRNVNALMLRSHSLLKRSVITAHRSRLIVCNNRRRECWAGRGKKRLVHFRLMSVPGWRQENAQIFKRLRSSFLAGTRTYRSGYICGNI